MAQSWSDRKIEDIVGIILRVGVSLSALIVLAGGLIYLARNGGSHPDYQVFRAEPSEFRTFAGIVRCAAEFRGRGIIQFGLVLLIATPVMRVLFSIWGFFEEHDRMYVVFTTIVLGVLLYSLLGSGSAF
jgi:uncharacterized membrane protein